MNDSVVDFLGPTDLHVETNGVETGLRRTHAYVFIEELSSAWKERERLDVLVLRAICRLSVRHPERANEGFSSHEIVEVVGALRGRRWSEGNDKNQMSDDVRRQWNKLTATWDSKIEGISQSLADDNFLLLPKLEKTEGGGTGRQSLYRIEWELRDEQDTATAPSRTIRPITSAARDIRYICEDIQDANAFSRFFTKGLELTGWKKAVYVTTICAPLLLGWLLFVVFAFGMTVSVAIAPKTAINSVLSLAAIFWAVWVTVGPLWELPTKKLVIAPWWMQSIDDDRLLEHRYPPRFPVKSIKAVRYTATCPICGGKISAQSGGVEFWRRIVGRCEDAPVEHVYSFDHVSRSGYALRRM